jgi:hypothetical protein
MLRLLTASLLFALSAAAGAQSPSVELLVRPQDFLVDGQSFSTATEAVAAALAKDPKSLALPGTAPQLKR